MTISIVRSDVSINTRRDDDTIFRTFRDIGSIYEDRGRYLDAAHVYQEAAELGYFGDWKYEADLFNSCGFCFKTATDYEKAEEAYLKSLRVASNHTPIGSLDLHGEENGNRLYNLLLLYNFWTYRPAACSASSAVPALIEPALFNLISLGGFQGTPRFTNVSFAFYATAFHCLIDSRIPTQKPCRPKPLLRRSRLQSHLRHVLQQCKTYMSG